MPIDQSLTICLTGDSISEGYAASGFIGAPPFQPASGELVAAGLDWERTQASERFWPRLYAQMILALLTG